jgi:hypothetical protein
MRTSLEGCEKVWDYTGCKSKHTVDKGLWGIGGGYRLHASVMGI